MILVDLFKETIWSLSSNKARSGLTILGIVIGIASVIALMAIGQGTQSSVTARIQSIGSNLIVVVPGAIRTGGVSTGIGSAQTLKLEDADAISASVLNINGVAPEDTHTYQVVAGANNTNTRVIGTVPAYPSVRNVLMDSGDFFTDQNERSFAKVAVLGPAVRDDLFGIGNDPIGQSIRIKNINFQVIGVTQSKGGSGFQNPDDAVYIPLTSQQHYVSGDDFITAISISASSQELMNVVQNDISSLLLKRHHIGDPKLADFNIINQTDIISTASSVTETFTILLASIAGISLLVGGIGIMNMMLTTVTERTREIGLRKAVGIRKTYINMQFLLEAVVLTFSGGVIGILLGWIVVIIVANFANIPTQISSFAIALAFGVSTIVGIVFGFYPARRAANLSPMEALRHE